ncbi:MAG: 1-deoxy-D-xylulose-5-phosphate synthase, partial [Deltaproteobacteria bacterium]|nr:1-deoxy-D-xylulose-5-phosphate synthase [Deltaproteobacteria bacterium]
QHAVTFAAGLATRGYRPFVAVYSTFLQRSYDQIVHDVCIQNLPVVFCVDRAGIVGEDGTTHQGLFDLAYLRHIPNMAIFAPADEEELVRGLYTAIRHEGPFALRYPRGRAVGVPRGETHEPVPPGTMRLLREGDGGIAVVGVGPIVHEALAAAAAFEKDWGERVAVYDARWVKPLPEQELLDLARSRAALLLLEEGTGLGGFSSGVLELLGDAGPFPHLAVRRLTLPDAFIEHGAAAALRAKYGLSKESIYKALRVLLSNSQKKR